MTREEIAIWERLLAKVQILIETAVETGYSFCENGRDIEEAKLTVAAMLGERLTRPRFEPTLKKDDDIIITSTMIKDDQTLRSK